MFESKKASRLSIGYLYQVFYRNIQPSFLCRLFTSMIRPILEYACQVWDPYTVMNRQKIENIQKYALRICAGRWLASYEELLDVFYTSYVSQLQGIFISTTLSIPTFHRNS